MKILYTLLIGINNDLIDLHKLNGCINDREANQFKILITFTALWRLLLEKKALTSINLCGLQLFLLF